MGDRSGEEGKEQLFAQGRALPQSCLQTVIPMHTVHLGMRLVAPFQ